MNKRNAERVAKEAGAVLAANPEPHRTRSAAGKTGHRHDQNTASAGSRESSAPYVPEFRTQEESDAWWDALPKVESDVDPRLKERVKTSIRLSRRTIDGFDHLAKQKGIRSGQTLMKIVLESYLAKSLPPDF